MDKLTELIAHYNTLVLRQRLIVLVAFLALVYFLWYLLFILPVEKHVQNIKAENAYLSSLYQESSELKVKAESNNKALGIVSLNNKLLTLKKEVAVLNSDLKKYFSLSDSTDNLMNTIRGLVANTQGLKLDSIELLPVEEIVIEIADNQVINNSEAAINPDEDDQQNSDAANVLIYKHKIYVHLQGSYTGLARYLQQVESLQQGLFTEGLHYKVEQHPNAKVSLLLYRLSLGES